MSPPLRHPPWSQPSRAPQRTWPCRDSRPWWWYRPVGTPRMRASRSRRWQSPGRRGWGSRPCWREISGCGARFPVGRRQGKKWHFHIFAIEKKKYKSETVFTCLFFCLQLSRLSCLCRNPDATPIKLGHRHQKDFSTVPTSTIIIQYSAIADAQFLAISLWVARLSAAHIFTNSGCSAEDFKTMGRETQTWVSSLSVSLKNKIGGWGGTTDLHFDKLTFFMFWVV